MKQKLEKFKKQIRRREINCIFQRRRHQLLEQQSRFMHSSEIIEAKIENQQQPSISYDFQRRPIPLLPEEFQIYDQNSHEAQSNSRQMEILQEVQIIEHEMSHAIIEKDYLKALHSLNQINKQLKIFGQSTFVKHELTNFFAHIAGTLLPEKIIHALILCAQEANISQRYKICYGCILEQMCLVCIDLIWKMFTNLQKYDENALLEMNFLVFLFYASSQPLNNKNHVEKIISIVVWLMFISNKQHYQIFARMADTTNSNNKQFNFNAIFYQLSKFPYLQATESLLINFIIMLKHYFLYVEDQRLRENGKELKSFIQFNKYQIDMCYEICLKEINYYSKIVINGHVEIDNECDVACCLDESLEVLRVLIEHELISLKKKVSVNYGGLLDLLEIASCPLEVKHLILIIIDHLVFSDDDQSLTFTHIFIKNDLVRIIWALKEEECKPYILNILCNITRLPEFKPIIAPFVNQIFLRLKIDSKSNLILYNFIYNWFSSQNFQVNDARDRLILEHLAESQETRQDIIALEAALWARLIENGHHKVPRRILEQDDLDTVKYIKELLQSQGNDEI